MRFSVTVRGGGNWQYIDSSSTAVPQVTYVDTTYGTGGTVVGTFHQAISWFANPDGGGVPEEFDEKVVLYAIRNEPKFKTIDVKLPVRYQLTAHCTG